MKTTHLTAWLALAVAAPFGVDACELRDLGVPVKQVRLSNGQEVPVPTRTDALDSYILFGRMDLKAVAEVLAPQGLYPVQVRGHALGALSVFDYRRSDLGPFRESYLAIVTTTDRRLSERDSSLELRKLFRWHPASPVENIGLYHDLAWSTVENARLMSEEVWGIPSYRATRIDVPASDSKRNWRIAVHAPEGPIFSMEWEKSPARFQPKGHDLFLNALGPALLWSPVESCGNSRWNRFDARQGDRLEIHHPLLKATLEKLQFDPWIIEASTQQKAIQYAPRQ